MGDTHTQARGLTMSRAARQAALNSARVNCARTYARAQHDLTHSELPNNLIFGKLFAIVKTVSQWQMKMFT